MLFQKPMMSSMMYPYLGYQGVKAGINWGSLFTNAQKALGFVNQAVPAFYQIKPLWNNAKTMFKVVNEVKKDDMPKSTTTREYKATPSSEKLEQKNINSSYIKPRFFV